MSPIKTTALAVLIVALGLFASIRLGNAGPLAMSFHPHAGPFLVVVAP
jgi:hypothetical protein